MQQKRIVLLITLLALITSFILLSFFVSYHPVPALDLKISLFVQKYHSDILDKIMLGISFFGELPYSLLMVVVVAAIFYAFKYKREAYFILSILLSGVVILGIKNIIDRPRPTAFYVRLVEINRFQSYPSGHVLSYVLFFGFMIFLMRKLNHLPQLTRRIVTYFSAFFMATIAFSRIYLGAHWFSDTLGGFLLGLICLFPLCFFYLKKKRG
ncbi:phosphatase PAP2 family protein [Pedobacter boryungensis]|uniref:Phosphatase PAP2 family protein n=1 Tax=Pedobacter boryungensis TaxID=869962 RepID=A0ABX2DBA0_9SPHI|nr:phosphatase PAP2 family protein [Pedobacter boryungensis]NQX31230.1 phosphatase PAP2 family protein [Pedobacter boryungensis]